MRIILLGVVVLAACFGGTLWALNTFSPDNVASDGAPALAELPPLKPATQTSYVIAPVAIANTAIRDKMDAAAPRNLAGKRDNPLSEVLGKADIGWTLARGPIAVNGRPDALTISTAINGSLRVTGQLSGQLAGKTGNIAGALNNLLGEQLGGKVQGLTTQALDQHADIRGNVTVTARPALQPNWRIEPNLTGQVSIADGGLSVAGFKLNVSNEVKPMLDKNVGEQIAALSNQMRNDPTLEKNARQEWAKMCRSIPLGATTPGAPNLWLEVRPIRAAAAQPKIDAAAVTLTIGVQAETRILPNETKPECPFPAKLDLVPQMDQGKMSIAVPIDMPFTELNRLLESQLKGKTFGDEAGSAAAVTVQSAAVAASGDRLRIALKVKARENKSWFGFGADANVQIWGKPVLDQAQQILRLTDITVDVDSAAAFGLIGTAARAAIPYLQSAVAKSAVVDLKPFATKARQSIEAAIGDFQKQADGLRTDAAITGLRLLDIEFDSKTLRVIANAEGSLRVAVSKLTGP